MIYIYIPLYTINFLNLPKPQVTLDFVTCFRELSPRGAGDPHGVEERQG